MRRDKKPILEQDISLIVEQVRALSCLVRTFNTRKVELTQTSGRYHHLYVDLRTGKTKLSYHIAKTGHSTPLVRN